MNFQLLNFGILSLMLVGCLPGKSEPNPGLTVDEFIFSLNRFDDVGESSVVLNTNETHRGSVPGEDQWFVIYDSLHNRYRAVSLDYLRTIAYEASNRTGGTKYGFGLGREFRSLEPNSDGVEFVSFNHDSKNFVGETSGWEYEDEAETTDVALMAGEREEIAFFRKASRISFAFSVDVKTAVSLVALGREAERVLESRGELTEEDQRALTAAFENLAGVTRKEVVEAIVDGEKRKALISRIAENIGTTAENLETRLLPGLFGFHF